MIEPVAQPPHPLLTVLHDAADGRFPPVDGGVEVLPPWRDGLAAVVSFTGHAYVATELGARDLADLAPDGFGTVLAPRLLLRLAGDGGTVGVIDATLVARASGPRGTPSLEPTTDLDDHPRVRHARAIRDDVEVFADERGLVTLGNGLAGRTELSIEVDAAHRGGGTGAAVLRDALALPAAGTPVFAAVSPGNARSLRSFLAAGFVVLGSEVTIAAAGSTWDAMVASRDRPRD